MVTAAWLQRKIDEREKRLRAEAEAKGEARILALLDDNTRNDVERELARRKSESD